MVLVVTEVKRIHIFLRTLLRDKERILTELSALSCMSEMQKLVLIVLLKYAIICFSCRNNKRKNNYIRI